MTATDLIIALHVPNYFFSVVHNQIRFLITIIDRASVIRDFPHHRFAALNFSTSYSSFRLYNLPADTIVENNNYMFGLSAVRFSLISEPSFSFECIPGFSTADDVTFFFYGYSPTFAYWYTYTRWIYFICNNP